MALKESRSPIILSGFSGLQLFFYILFYFCSGRRCRIHRPVWQEENQGLRFLFLSPLPGSRDAQLPGRGRKFHFCPAPRFLPQWPGMALASAGNGLTAPTQPQL